MVKTLFLFSYYGSTCSSKVSYARVVLNLLVSRLIDNSWCCETLTCSSFCENRRRLLYEHVTSSICFRRLASASFCMSSMLIVTFCWLASIRFIHLTVLSPHQYLTFRSFTLKVLPNYTLHIRAATTTTAYSLWFYICCHQSDCKSLDISIVMPEWSCITLLRWRTHFCWICRVLSFELSRVIMTCYNR
jgi:hypothetical protein